MPDTPKWLIACWNWRPSSRDFWGVETTRDNQGLGITVCYWTDEATLKAWKDVSEHLLSQKLGKTRWYEYYTLRVAKVERAYAGPKGR